MKKEWKTQLFERLDGYLKPKGFKLIKNRDFYLKKTTDGFITIFFDFVDRFMETDIDIRFDIRFNQIEQIEARINERYDDKESVTIFYHYHTLLEEKTNIDPLSVIPYQIKNDSDIDKIVESFQEIMKQCGFAFFDQFQSVVDYDRWFNDKVLAGTYDFKRELTWNDSISGLAAAWLNKNPNFNKLYELWLEILEETGEENVLQNVLALKKYTEENGR